MAPAVLREPGISTIECQARAPVSRRLDPACALAPGGRRIDPPRRSLQRPQRIDLDRQSGVERCIEVDWSVATRVAHDARSLLDVVARVVRVAMDPRCNR